MDALPLMKHTEMLRQRLSLAGIRVADVGCSDGALVRVMARSGAWVVGIDPGPQQLARARAVPPAGGSETREAYVCAARAGPELDEVAEFYYRAPFRVRSFEAFRDSVIAIDPGRKTAIEAAEASLRQAFLAAAEQRDGGFCFEISSRPNLLRRN